MKKAFSLIELSIVILIIGILVAGVTQSSRLINAMRLASAQTMTQSSPISSIRNLLFWYETSLPTSFITTEAIDGTVITQWNDNNPQAVSKVTAWAGQKTNSALVSYNTASSATSGNTSGPTYIENGINGIPTLRFTNAATTYRYLTVDYDAKNLSNDNITAFVVINYRSGGGWIFDRTCVNGSGVPITCASAPNTGSPLFGSQIDTSRNLLFDRRDSARVEMGGNFYFDTGYDIAVGTKYVLTFERKYGSSFIAYVNGIATGTTNSDTIGVIPMDPVKIGRHAENNIDTLDIDVSEMILFGGNLKSADRELIENYLGKKYGVKVN